MEHSKNTALLTVAVSILTSLHTIFVNLVIGSSHLVAQMRLKEAGAGSVAITGTLSLWAVVTALTAYCVGRVLSENNARRFLQSSAALMLLTFIGFLLFPQTAMLYCWLFMIGVATGLFCGPLQVFLKKLERGKSSGVIRASALYSASWSFGMAVGPFIFGMLSLKSGGEAWKTAFRIDAALMLIVLILPAAAEFLAEKKGAVEVSHAQNEIDFSKKPDLALAGWVLTVFAFASVAVTKTLLPDRGPGSGLTAANISVLVALIYFGHSFTSLCLVNSKDWMYRRAVVAVFVGLGITGLACFLFLPLGNFRLLAVGAVLIGMCSGLIGFCLVFYSLAHPAKAARYVAVNEVTVGLTNTLSPLVIGSGSFLLTGQVWVPFAILIAMGIPAVLFHGYKIKKAE